MEKIKIVKFILYAKNNPEILKNLLNKDFSLIDGSQQLDDGEKKYLKNLNWIEVRDGKIGDDFLNNFAVIEGQSADAAVVKTTLKEFFST